MIVFGLVLLGAFKRSKIVVVEGVLPFFQEDDEEKWILFSLNVRPHFL